MKTRDNAAEAADFIRSEPGFLELALTMGAFALLEAELAQTPKSSHCQHLLRDAQSASAARKRLRAYQTTLSRKERTYEPRSDSQQ